jgi:hypothetical protein
VTELRPDVSASEDISILFEQMPEIPCASPSHETDEVHYGPATHYAQLRHECVFPDGTVFPVCAGLAEHLRSGRELIEEFGMLLCQNCGTVFKTVERWVVVLGPIPRGAGGGGRK